MGFHKTQPDYIWVTILTGLSMDTCRVSKHWIKPIPPLYIKTLPYPTISTTQIWNYSNWERFLWKPGPNKKWTQSSKIKNKLKKYIWQYIKSRAKRGLPLVFLMFCNLTDLDNFVSPLVNISRKVLSNIVLLFLL